MKSEKRVRCDAPSSLQGQVVKETSREVQEATARCVAVMVCYQNEQRSSSTEVAMCAEIRTVASWFAVLSLSAGALDRDLFRRVEEQLVARYGRLAGGCLNDEFLEAFEAGWADRSV